MRVFDGGGTRDLPWLPRSDAGWLVLWPGGARGAIDTGAPRTEEPNAYALAAAVGSLGLAAPAPPLAPGRAAWRAEAICADEEALPGAGPGRDLRVFATALAALLATGGGAVSAALAIATGQHP